MFRLLILSSVAAVTVTAIALTGSGLLLEGPQPPLERSDAIIVISGDEGFARLREGVRLFQQGWARRLIVSGAAEDGVLSNAHSMRSHAVESGVPPSAILVEPEAMDTFGNAGLVDAGRDPSPDLPRAGANRLYRRDRQVQLVAHARAYTPPTGGF
jgi:uncharacterized SAM-binding protein YcdF (DUF218 family)